MYPKPPKNYNMFGALSWLFLSSEVPGTLYVVWVGGGGGGGFREGGGFGEKI